MEGIFEFITGFFIVVGALFALIGSWGLVRLPTLMERLHGPTKATTLGLGGMLIGSVLHFQAVRGEWTAHELLITLFLFITAPIAANMIAKVHLHRHRVVRDEVETTLAGPPPEVPGGGAWATYEQPPADSPAATSRY